MFKDHVEIKASGHLPPASLGKTLDLREQPDGEHVQMTITNLEGQRESIVVLWGDLNAGAAAMGHDPAQG